MGICIKDGFRLTDILERENGCSDPFGARESARKFIWALILAASCSCIELTALLSTYLLSLEFLVFFQFILKPPFFFFYFFFQIFDIKSLIE